jgi:hypothetical protein
MSPEEVFKPGETEAAKSYGRRAVWLLVFSVIGFTSPVALLVGTIWYLARKREIADAGSTVRAMVLISLAICIAYIVLMFGGYEIFQMRAGEKGGTE